MKYETARTETTSVIEVEARLETKDVEDLLRSLFPSTVGHKCTNLGIEVPSGGDYSGMALEPGAFLVRAIFERTEEK